VTNDVSSIQPKPAPLADTERVRVLLEEFRALYGLLSFRLAAVERSLPVAGGTLAAILSGSPTLPIEVRRVVLLAMPAALLWLLRTTCAHARSKEDVLRRIDEIERQVNQLAGEELLVFQSRHPNRRRVVAGRSGGTTVLGALGFSLTGVTACAWMGLPLWPGQVEQYVYAGFVVAIATFLTVSVWRLLRYAYRKAEPTTCPLFIGRRPFA
jgi:membrane protein implicated in regulation of membrane protease activity